MAHTCVFIFYPTNLTRQRVRSPKNFLFLQAHISQIAPLQGINTLAGHKLRLQANLLQNLYHERRKSDLLHFGHGGIRPGFFR